jgi:hypothetical protein
LGSQTYKFKAKCLFAASALAATASAIIYHAVAVLCAQIAYEYDMINKIIIFSEKYGMCFPQENPFYYLQPRLKISFTE